MSKFYVPNTKDVKTRCAGHQKCQNSMCRTPKIPKLTSMCRTTKVSKLKCVNTKNVKTQCVPATKNGKKSMCRTPKMAKLNVPNNKNVKTHADLMAPLRNRLVSLVIHDRLVAEPMPFKVS